MFYAFNSCKTLVIERKGPYSRSSFPNQIKYLFPGLWEAFDAALSRVCEVSYNSSLKAMKLQETKANFCPYDCIPVRVWSDSA